MNITVGGGTQFGPLQMAKSHKKKVWASAPAVAGYAHEWNSAHIATARGEGKAEEVSS